MVWKPTFDIIVRRFFFVKKLDVLVRVTIVSTRRSSLRSSILKSKRLRRVHQAMLNIEQLHFNIFILFDVFDLTEVTMYFISTLIKGRKRFL